jgi:outer membrane biosynthesis protein TonB
MTFIYLCVILALVCIAVAYLQLKNADLSQIEEAGDEVLDEFFGDTEPTPPPVDLFEEKQEVVEPKAEPVVEPIVESKPEVKELVQELVAKEEVKVETSRKKKKKYNKPRQ